MTQATSNSATAERIDLGIASAMTGLFGLAVMDACAKFLGAGYAISQIVLVRNGIAVAAVLLFVMWGHGGLARLKPSKPGMLLLRTATNLCAAYMFFTSLRYLPLANAFAIAFAAPLFITALSGPVLGEGVGVRRWAAVVFGFIGVLVVLQPGAETFQIESLLPLGAALSYAIAMLVGRKMTRAMNTSAIIFWPSVGVVAAMALLMPTQWQTPDLNDAGLFLFMGIIGTIGMSLITQGYRYAPAAVIAPFDYSVLIWGVIFGWVIWNDVPTLNVWVGSAILIGCGLYILHRETRTPKPVQPVPGPLGPTS